MTSPVPPEASSRPTVDGPDSQPVDIPIQSTRVDSTDGSFSASLRRLVGSPENLSSHPSPSMTEYCTPETPGAIRSPAGGNEHPEAASVAGPSRPAYQRSVTSPAPTPGARQRQPSIATVAGVTSSLLRLSLRGRRGRNEHAQEWSVFGELMGQDQDDENRRAPSTSILRRPTARESIRDVLSVNYMPSQKTSPISPKPPPSPGYDLNQPMTDEPERSQTPDSEDRVTFASEAEESSHEDSSVTCSPENASEAKQKKTRFDWLKIPTLTLVQRNILKCAIAYFVGSLFTFNPYLSSFIADLTNNGPEESRPSPSGHMVATV